MNQLKKELEGLITRRAQLAAELEQTHAGLSTMRTALIAGGSRPLAANIGAQYPTALALGEAVAELDTRIENLRASLAEAEADEANQAKLDRLAAIQSEREQAANEYWAARAKLNDALASHVAAIRAARARWYALTTEGQALGGTFTNRMANRPAEAPYVEAINSAIGTADRLQERQRASEASQRRADRLRRLEVTA